MRLRYNNSAGTLGSPALTAGATGIVFASAPPFATIVAPDFIPLVLDPPQGATLNPSFEIVYLTAYTSGATSGVIVRGQEGSTGTSHNVGAVWAVAPTALDLNSMAPIGSILPYSGVGDPAETNWLIADGRLIDKTIYAEFYKRTGHAYNLNIDPGSNQVKIPDKRGLKSIGAINMGTAAGAGPSDNAHIGTAARGFSGGVATVTLTNGQMPNHSHGGTTNTGTAAITLTDPGHRHGITDPAHTHLTPFGGATNFMVSGGTGTGIALNDVGGTFQQSPYANVQYSTTNITQTDMLAAGGTHISSSDSGHAHAIFPDGGSASHPVSDPYQADCYIVRVA